MRGPLTSALLCSFLDFFDSLAEALDFLHLALRGVLVFGLARTAQRFFVLLHFLLQLMHFLLQPFLFFPAFLVALRGPAATRLAGLAALPSGVLLSATGFVSP